MYANGEGVRSDASQAAHWYRKAAEQGHAGAQSNLGASYLFGTGVPIDSRAAVEWFRKAAEQGHAGGQANMGFIYLNGKGVPDGRGPSDGPAQRHSRVGDHTRLALRHLRQNRRVLCEVQDGRHGKHRYQKMSVWKTTELQHAGGKYWDLLRDM